MRIQLLCVLCELLLTEIESLLMAQLSFKYSMFSGSGSDGLMLEALHHHHHHQCKLLKAFGRFQYAAYLSQLTALGNDRKLLSFSASLNNYNNSEDDVSLSAFDHEIDELAGFRGLVLDLSYRPVNVVCWKRAICLEFMDKADVLEYYDQTINSPSGSFYIPAVLRVPHLLQVVKRRKVKRGLSRKHIFQRDNFTCQYCYSIENLTIDHVLPIARGGKWTWENLVAACAKCNSKKGQKTLEEASMKLIKVPKAPKDYDILAIPLTNHAIKMLKTRKGMPEEWRQYLSKPYAAP